LGSLGRLDEIPEHLRGRLGHPDRRADALLWPELPEHLAGPAAGQIAYHLLVAAAVTAAWSAVRSRS